MYKSEPMCCSLAIQLQGLKLEDEVVEKNTLEESKDNTGHGRDQELVHPTM